MLRGTVKLGTATGWLQVQGRNCNKLKQTALWNCNKTATVDLGGPHHLVSLLTCPPAGNQGGTKPARAAYPQDGTATGNADKANVTAHVLRSKH